MDYRFNYDFLGEFLQRNHLNKLDVLKVLGTQDYTTVNRWLQKVNPIATETILRLCNTFGLPLSVFFYDLDTPRPITIGNPPAGATTTAIGGYNTGKRNTTDPQAKEKMRRVWPDDTDDAPMTAKTEESVTDDVQLIKLQLDYERRINTLQEEHKKEIDALRAEYVRKSREQKTTDKEMTDSLRQEITFLRSLVKKDGYTLPGDAYASDYTNIK